MKRILRKNLISFLLEKIISYKNKVLAIQKLASTMPLFFNGHKELGIKLNSTKEYMIFTYGKMCAYTELHTLLKEIEYNIVNVPSKK